MKKLLSAVFFLGLLLTLTACPLETREDLRQQDDDRQLKEQVTTIQRSKADSEQRFTDVQNDMRVIAGRVDAVEHNDQTAQQNARSEIEKLRVQVMAQNDKMKLMEQHVDAVEMRLTAAIQALNSAQAPQQISSQNSSGEEARGKKKEAASLEEAETLFESRDYKKAIVQFESYRTKHAKGPRAAEATYKIGVCFAELGLKKDAREFYQETIENFPGTVQSKKAKARLTQLKSN